MVQVEVTGTPQLELQVRVLVLRWATVHLKFHRTLAEVQVQHIGRRKAVAPRPHAQPVGIALLQYHQFVVAAFLGRARVADAQVEQGRLVGMNARLSWQVDCELGLLTRCRPGLMRATRLASDGLE